MEIIISIILTINVITQLVIIKNFKNFQTTKNEYFQYFPGAIEIASNHDSQIEEVPLAPILEEVHAVPVPKESYQAWKNRTEEPVVAPRSPHGPPPKTGPLERPSGFAL